MGQRAAPQVYQAEPPQRGRCGNLTTEINCLFPGLCMELGRSKQPIELSKVTTSHIGQTWCPDPTSWTGCLVPLSCQKGWGLWAGAGTSWGRRGVSHTQPWSYLGRCQQTSIPYVGVLSRGARGRQGETHMCKHTHTQHTHAPCTYPDTSVMWE